MKLGVTLDILNQKDTPAFYADTLANRPAAGFTGRVFISTDTLDLYRDTGTTWVLLSPSSTGTITGSGAAGQVTYFSAASSITGSNDLFFDSVNGHLGIGTITPSTALTIFHDQNQIIQINQTTATNDTKIAFQNSGTPLWRIGNSYNAAANDFGIYDVVGSIQPLTIKKTTGQTFIGTQTTSSGRLVVNDTTGDNHIVAIGATSPSIRVRNAGTSPTQQFGLGLSTATNNFIQGSASGDFCLFNGSTTASPMLFGIYDAGAGNVQEAARISAARNFLVGKVTDSGEKLQITGTSKLNGLLTINAGNATNGILVDSGIANTDIQIFPSSSFSRISLRSQGTQADISIVAGASINFRTSQAGVNTLIGTTLTSAGGGVEYYASQNGALAFHKWFYNGGEIMRLTATNLLIGTTTDAGFRLDVNGTGRVTGAFSTDNITVGQGAGTTYKTIFTSVGGNPAIIQSIATIGSGSAANNVMQFRCFDGFNPTGQLTISGDGTNVFEQSNTPTRFSSAMVAINSTTKGFLPPRMTTAQKNAIGTPATGLVVYDTTLNKLAVYTGATWETITSV
jgi:hypothetical protein